MCRRGYAVAWCTSARDAAPGVTRRAPSRASLRCMASRCCSLDSRSTRRRVWGVQRRVSVEVVGPHRARARVRRRQRPGGAVGARHLRGAASPHAPRGAAVPRAPQGGAGGWRRSERAWWRRRRRGAASAPTACRRQRPQSSGALARRWARLTGHTSRGAPRGSAAAWKGFSTNERRWAAQVIEDQLRRPRKKRTVSALPLHRFRCPQRLSRRRLRRAPGQARGYLIAAFDLLG